MGRSGKRIGLIFFNETICHTLKSKYQPQIQCFLPNVKRTIMANHLDSAEIEIPCSNCKRKTKKSISWIKSHSNFTCACGTKINIDARQFKSEIDKVERQLASLFKGFGK